MSPEQTHGQPIQDHQPEREKWVALADKEQIKEMFRNGLDEARIVFHGIAAAVQQKKMERSGSRMERMDHKNALYTDLGHLATTGTLTESPTASGKPAMPQTAVERWVDKRLDKKAEKHMEADIAAYRARKIFGPRESLPGMNKQEKREDKRAIRRLRKDGTLLATEARQLTIETNATPLKLGEELHEKTHKKLVKAEKRLVRAAEQPRLTPWREHRQRRAVDAIMTHHYKAEEHRTKKSQLKQARRDRAAA